MSNIDDKKLRKYMGWVGLGICLDYFIFKPIRALRPLVLMAAGFFTGIFSVEAACRILDFVKYILG